MIRASVLQGMKKLHLRPTKRISPAMAIGLGLCLLLGLGWYLIVRPLQAKLELRLQQYPLQLASIQDLNRNLLTYKNKEIPTLKISESEFSNFKNNLTSQGLQFSLLRLETTNPALIRLQLNEIEFTQWLALVEAFRKKNGLYVRDAVIKQTKGLGLVQVTATFAQVP